MLLIIIMIINEYINDNNNNNNLIYIWCIVGDDSYRSPWSAGAAQGPRSASELRLDQNADQPDVEPLEGCRREGHRKRHVTVIQEKKGKQSTYVLYYLLLFKRSGFRNLENF